VSKALSSVGIGVVGLGYWGPNLVRNFHRQLECEVRFLCDFDAGRRAAVGVLYPNAIQTSDSNEVISSRHTDVVVICTPPSSHFVLAKQALLAGKHVFLAKPTTLIPEESLELADIAESSGLLLHTDHTFVYSPPVRKVKEVMSDPGFGPLNYIDSVRINLGLFQSDTNVVWDLAPHDLSILNYLLDESPQMVVAQSNKPLINGNEHLAYVSLHYASGLIANLHLNWLSPVKVRKTIIGGTKKMVIYDDMESIEKVKVLSRGIDFDNTTGTDTHRDLVQYRIGDIYAPVVDTAEALDIQCREFLRAVQNGDSTHTSGIEGYKVVLLCDAINRSLKSGGHPIAVNV
jgi:predicted dehydrogenase